MTDQTVAAFACPRCGEPYRVCRGKELEIKADVQTLDRLNVALEIKAVDIPGRTIEGYASVTGNVDGVADVIEPGGFKRTLTEHNATSFKDLDAYIGHQHRIGALPVGMPVAVREDAHGLFTKTLIHNSSDGNDLLTVAAERMAAGKPLGMSIGYNPTDFKWETKDGQMVRHIKDLDLGEYSFTAMPANTQAVVTAIKAVTPPAELETKVGRSISASRAARYLDQIASARKALDEIEADIKAEATATDATEKAVIANTEEAKDLTKNEAVAGPFDLAIALAKARGGIYA